MFSKPLFKQTVKSNFKMYAIFTGLLCLLITIILSVFVPSTMASINSTSGNLPFNPLGDISTLIAFVSNQYFGMMAIVLPMIFLIMVGNKMIAGQVDKGSMAYNLSTPTTRVQIASTSAFYLIGSLALLFGFIAAVGTGAAAISQPGVLDYNTFIMLTFGCFLLQFAISAIVFFASCVFNYSSKSFMLGAGLPIIFFVFKLLSGMSDKLEFLKYMSLNTLFDTNAIMNGEGFAVKLIVLAVIGVVLYAAGIKVFKEKDLPL
ncbi:MAG: ABC transporter permease subunit [Eubacteriales bacterium]